MLGSEDTTKEVAYSLRVEEWKSVGNSESWGKSMSAGVEQDKGRESWKDSGHSDETEKKLAKMDYIEQGRELYEIRIRWRPRFRSGNKGHGLDFISRAQRNQGGVLSKRMAWHFYFIKITPELYPSFFYQFLVFLLPLPLFTVQDPDSFAYSGEAAREQTSVVHPLPSAAAQGRHAGDAR